MIVNGSVTFKEIKYSIGITIIIIIINIIIIIIIINSLKKGMLNSMKGVLSYYHTTLKVKRPLCDAEYLYAIPIIYCHYPPMPV